MQVKHKMPPRRSKTFTRRPQDGQRGPQDTRRRTLDAPKTPPGRFQDGPRCPKTPLRHPTRPSGRSKTPPRCSKTSPRHPKAPPDLDFGAVAPGFLKLVGPPRPHPGLPEAPFWLVLRSLADGVSDHIRKSSFQFAPPYPPSSGADLHDDYAKIDAPDIHSFSVSA